jgi:hypothetical protein
MVMTRSRHLAEQEARDSLNKLTMSSLINNLYSDTSFDEEEVAPRRCCLCQFIGSLFSSFTR